jgi:hypothetical protein
MKRMLVLLGLCATVAVPVAAFAQAGPPGMQPPTPEQRAMMDKARADAKTAAYLNITPAHAERVNAIIADVAAGKRDPREAAKLIDDVLTPDEQKAVRDAEQASRSAMRGSMGMGGPPPRPPAPPPAAAGQAGQAEPPPPQGRRFGPPSAGRYLIRLSMTPEQMRATQPRARSSAAQ